MSFDRYQTYILSAIIIMSLVTYLTRVVPFIFFQNIKNELIKKTGSHLPVCLMAILTIHSIDSLKEFDPNYLINGWIACASSVLFYCTIRSVLVSMILGTTVYYFVLNYL
ncbi:hypothetical protein GCL60_13775 [Silvanigrella paludirubra]|jgi:branched-subunit amino acid transport protein AzlD|uniref:AzlD domain-containing protein n=1 Tax=Silvanigrella paludirubra TaxID=2499159 RepID=A0A6N6VP15_9BACT|nr:AzlD domain-containing protein [Silvanigrella paludirubra]KAB8036908.1 hypothetical protein GCL60_13775 [Silvanigrella paludirubra]